MECDTEAEELGGPIRVAGRVLGSAPHVRLLGVQAGEPCALVGPGQMRCRRLGDRQKVLTVCRRYGSGFVRAGLGEPVGGELADGLQQPVAEGPAGGLCHDEALVHQRAEQVGDLNRLDVTEAANRFGGVQIEAFREDRQAPQQQRREPGLQARRIELEDLLRAAEVLQPVGTQVQERHAGRERVADQGGRRLREQDLAPVRHGRHPGGAVDIQAHQTGGRLRRLTGMDTHPHPHTLPRRPCVCLQGLLDRHHRRHAGLR